MSSYIMLSKIYSYLFLIVNAIYLMFGAYIIIRNPKSAMNRVFFVVCMSLGIWAYSFSLANSAPDHESAFFWFRISVLGWGIVYSLLLHYFLILTNRIGYLKKKFVYVLLYAPGIVNIIAFGAYGPSARAEYELVETAAGWISVSEIGFFNWFFNIYYIIFSILCILLLWTWPGIKTDLKTKRIAMLISSSIIISLVIGSITDILLNSLLQEAIPQLGIVFVLIPTSVIFYIVKGLGLMKDYTRTQTFKTNQILTERTRFLFYRLLAGLYIAASLIIPTEAFIYNGMFSEVVLKSSPIFFIGLSVMVIYYLPFSVKKQDSLISIMAAGTIPLVILLYMNQSSRNIIWAAPFLLIIIAAIFNQRRMLILTVVTSILSQLWVWYKLADNMVTISPSDHFSRILINLIGAFIITYIGRIYQQRLLGNIEQSKIQRLVSEISAELVSVNEDNLDAKINWILQRNGEFFDVDRTYLFQRLPDKLFATYTHEWCAENIKSSLDNMELISIKAFPWWMEHMNKQQPFYIADVKSMPKEAQSEFALLESRQIKSMISFPVIDNNSVIGFIGFDSIKDFKVWNESHQKILQIMANAISDALVKVRSEKELHHMAYYDELTGLSNRDSFNNQLRKSIELAKRSEKFIGILFLDLDSFKSVNDTMGHKTGDVLLKEVARRFLKCVRKYDTICRFGGDEFLVMFPQINSSEELKQAAERLMSVFNDPVILNGQEFYISASAGVASYPTDGENGEALIKNADLAMYASKEDGKNRITYCNSIMKEVVKEKMKLSNDLYRAIERDELIVYYQPQVQIETGKIIGVEALLRWQHPEKGMIPPLNFIPLAEQTGLIHPIGEWVLQTACRQNKAWQEMGLEPVVMAVNLSVEQFRTHDLVQVVVEALEESDLSPVYLELEITESIAVKESDYIIPILNSLKELGVAISIDDFGTEYSSLSRLKELPVDRIKMAMEFVQGIDKGFKDEAIAMVIINLAKSLGLKVIAEGVETQGQLNFLTKGVCDEVQGFYLHRPMPAEEVEKIMGRGDIVCKT